MRGPLFFLCCLLCGPSAANEIGYVERFALSSDRNTALSELVPGTEEYFLYHCLHYEHTDNREAFSQMFDRWKSHHKGRITQPMQELLNRRALLDIDENPKASLDHIRRTMNLTFDHRQNAAQAPAENPTKLAPDLISTEGFLKRILQQRFTIDHYETEGLRQLATQHDLKPEYRRALLSNLNHPDFPGLIKLIAEDLMFKGSKGFGSMDIHRMLTDQQLAALVKRIPRLQYNDAFIDEQIKRLRPPQHIDLDRNSEARHGFLHAAWVRVKNLPPSQNSRKAHVLYHLLDHGRKNGDYDARLFLDYLKLPRPVSYMLDQYLQHPERRNAHCKMKAYFRAMGPFPEIGNDEILVRDYLLHLLANQPDADTYSPYLKDDYLQNVFAESKITRGIGNPETWASRITPDAYKTVKERVDIDFAPQNPTYFSTNEAIVLHADIKNVPVLLVKVFEINTFNYYRQKNSGLNLGMNLDGLAPSEEQEYIYEEPPEQRVRRTFKFPKLKGRGAYIVEFVGNGKASRALVIKGHLQAMTEPGSAGHIFRIFDETGTQRSKAQIWMGGKIYKADKDGEIIIPYSTHPSNEMAILQDGSFSSICHFKHAAEKYDLQAGIHIEREALIKHRTAQVVIRPTLRINGVPTTIELLEEVELEVKSHNHSGIESRHTIPGFELFNDRESVAKIRVPEHTSAITITLRGKIQNISQNKQQDLTRSRRFTLNQIDKTIHFKQALLTRDGDRHLLIARGKNGEPYAHHPVSIDFKHRLFKPQHQVALQTDKDGQIDLGRLIDITQIKVRGFNHQPVIRLNLDRTTYPRTLHAKAGEPLQISVPVQPNRHTLYRLNEGSYRVDVSQKATYSPGVITLNGLEAGQYELRLHPGDNRVDIQISQGKLVHGHIAEPHRLLEQSTSKPLYIESLTTDEDEVVIKLGNPNTFTRVHVLASRFFPEHDAFQALSQNYLPAPQQRSLLQPKSLFAVGRNIGDEYRYILQRARMAKFPGNMLERPGLLLNPWELQETQSANKDLALLEELEDMSNLLEKISEEAELAKFGGTIRRDGYFNLDFLQHGAVTLLNLVADANQEIRIKREAFKGKTWLRVLALDHRQAIARELALPQKEFRTREIRLSKAFDPRKPFAKQQQIEILKKGDPFSIQQTANNTFEVYDHFERLYRLLQTLSGSIALSEFDFIRTWPDFDEATKRDKYAKYACHELNFFLYKKDRPFFDEVVKPYLANKKDPTFMDHWLLGNDLNAYLQSWRYQRLNIVERILLAQRVNDQNISRQIRELNELIDQDRNTSRRGFLTALANDALADYSDPFASSDKESASFGFGTIDLAGGLANMPAPADIQETAVTEMFFSADDAFSDEEMAGEQSKVRQRKTKRNKQSITDSKDALEKTRSKSTLRAETESIQALDATEIRFWKERTEARASGRNLFRKLDQTRELAENNYYNLPIEQQVASLVTTSPFWVDYAAFDGKGPFLSKHFATAGRNFTESMFALSVLDLPFKPAKHDSATKEAVYRITAGSQMLILHEQVQAAEKAVSPHSVLISQKLYRHDDRYQLVDGEQREKYVGPELLRGVVYGAKIVLTNPTSHRLSLTLLLQIPEGAIPVDNGFYTESQPVELNAYATETVEYAFYFPSTGKFTHYPANLSEDGHVHAHAKSTLLHVVEALSKVDKTSWDWVSQHGTKRDVETYLERNNSHRVSLTDIAWRMKDRDFFVKIIQQLRAQYIYNPTLWSYSIHHDHRNILREYLSNSAFASQCGPALDSTVLTLDPVARHVYQHLEYAPLVNPRAHQTGKSRKILNDRFFTQYHQLMQVLAYKAELSPTDRLAVTYYLTLQDRIEEALKWFKSIEPVQVSSRLQYDYLKAYLAIYEKRWDSARALASRHKNHPIQHWQRKFSEILKQLDGKAVPVDYDNREQRQEQLAVNEPLLDFMVEQSTIKLNYQGLTRATLNFYPMDIELLFSRSPFIQGQSTQFSYIKPLLSREVELPADQNTFSYPLPKPFQKANVMVEAISSAAPASQAYYANQLDVRIIENYGQLHTDEPKTYVKVYALMDNGQIQFFKDGYTDFRGRFDYTSLNSGDVGNVQRFAILIMSETKGALITEVPPPKR